jgi:hypothetical protein
VWKSSQKRTRDGPPFAPSHGWALACSSGGLELNATRKVLRFASYLGAVRAIPGMRHLQCDVHELECKHRQRTKTALHWNVKLSVCVSSRNGCIELREADLRTSDRVTCARVSDPACDSWRARNHARRLNQREQQNNAYASQRLHTPNENKMSDGWRESASPRVEGGVS